MSRSNSITGETRAERPDEAFCLHLADRLDAAAIATVKQHADRHGTTLVDAVVAHGFLSENEAYRRFAEWMQHPFVDLHDTPVVATALRLLPERVARTREILPIAHDNRHLTYASARMFSDEVDLDVAFASGRRPRMVVVQRSQLMEALHRSYRVAQDVEKLIERIRLDETPKMEELSFQQGSESPVIELCNRIVASAIAAGASDIHVEPSADGAVVRHRIAGILEPVLNLPGIVVRGVTNRFKLMAKADIATKLKPQDGAFRIVLNKQVVDVRLSALPTIHGEKLVMRVIQGGDQVLAVDMLGYSRTAERTLLAALSKPDGLVLVTGPTGSGKTTVLYAALRFLQTGRVNIVSVEDPVERQVEGVTQIAVNGKNYVLLQQHQ